MLHSKHDLSAVIKKKTLHCHFYISSFINALQAADGLSAPLVAIYKVVYLSLLRYLWAFFNSSRTH